MEITYKVEHRLGAPAKMCCTKKLIQVIYMIHSLIAGFYPQYNMSSVIIKTILVAIFKCCL